MKAFSWLSQLIEGLGRKNDVEFLYVKEHQYLREQWKNKLLIYKKKDIITNIFIGPNHLNYLSTIIFFLKLNIKIDFYSTIKLFK